MQDETLERSGFAATVERLQTLVEREKAALGRHIHDDLGGFLIASAMDVAWLRHRFASQDDDAREKFDRLARMINGAVDMMRRVTEDLHPTLLDNVGLFAALRWKISHTCARSRIQCTDHLPEFEPDLSAASSINLFRVGQEALVVAENHSGVTRVDFTMKIEQDSFWMRIQTDGTRLPPEAENPGQIALGFLRQRIRAMRGELTLTQYPGEGMSLVGGGTIAA